MAQYRKTLVFIIFARVGKQRNAIGCKRWQDIFPLTTFLKLTISSMPNSIRSRYRRIIKHPVSRTLPTHTSPKEAACVPCASIWNHLHAGAREEFILVLLTTQRVLAFWRLTLRQQPAQPIVEPSAVFQTVLLGKANSYNDCHNHPSGVSLNKPSDIYIHRASIELREKC